MTFDEWSAINGLQHWNSAAITMMEDAWRSADRAAREECAAIVESIGDIEPASYVAEKIRETMK
jgi:hypothetical protein